MAILIASDDSILESPYTLQDKPIVLGRHPDCDISIRDDSVSRHHAQITCEAGHFYLQDLNSRNGTFLNNQSVHKTTKLYDQAEIRICDTTFVFSISELGAPETGEKRQRPSGPKRSRHPILVDDAESSISNVLSEFEIPSHYSRTHTHVSAEDKLATLLKVSRVLSESVQRDEVLDKILDVLFDLFTQADRGFIILENDEGKLVPHGMKTRNPKDVEQIRISRTIIKNVMETKRPIISRDASADDRFDMSQSLVDFRIHSIMCAPLINSQDEVFGVIQLDTLRQPVAFNEEELETLVAVAMQASLSIQKSDLFEDVKRSEGFRADLELAHELQQRFLPQREPPTDNFEFYSYYRPMQQVGGDYFDYVVLNENRIGIIVADVVGHGITAALLMAKVSAESRFALATTHSPVEAIRLMNASLSGMNIDRFVTLVLGMLDLETNRMTIVNAGHMPPLLRNSETGEITQLAIEESGLPLGILDDFDYQSVEVDFNPGDVIVMYTDGVNEAMDADGNQLGTATLIREIEESQAKTSEKIGERICNVVNRHAGQTPAIDDMCLVCVGRKP